MTSEMQSLLANLQQPLAQIRSKSRSVAFWLLLDVDRAFTNAKQETSGDTRQ